MADRGTQRMIYRILDNMPKKPSARALLEIRVVESAICGVVFCPCHDGVHDVRSMEVRRVFRIGNGWCRKVVFGSVLMLIDENWFFR